MQLGSFDPLSLIVIAMFVGACVSTVLTGGLLFYLWLRYAMSPFSSIIAMTFYTVGCLFLMSLLAAQALAFFHL